MDNHLKIISDLTDENRLYTWSACGNGIAWPEIGDHPKIKCVEREHIR